MLPRLLPERLTFLQPRWTGTSETSKTSRYSNPRVNIKAKGPTWAIQNPGNKLGSCCSNTGNYKRLHDGAEDRPMMMSYMSGSNQGRYSSEGNNDKMSERDASKPSTANFYNFKRGSFSNTPVVNIVDTDSRRDVFSNTVKTEHGVKDFSSIFTKAQGSLSRKKRTWYNNSAIHPGRVCRVISRQLQEAQEVQAVDSW